MALWTTYLAFLRKVDWNPCYVFPDELKETIFLYVMRNRGNNDVAPSEQTLRLFKENKITWKEYCFRYNDWIHRSFGIRRMKEIGELSNRANVVLICYEKDSEHCHRTILAKNIAKWSGCEYKGELNDSHLKVVGGGETNG